MAIATVEVEIDVDLETFETNDLINELDDRGYMVSKEQEILSETIETDIRGCTIQANGRTYNFSGMLKITVEG